MLSLAVVRAHISHSQTPDHRLFTFPPSPGPARSCNFGRRCDYHTVHSSLRRGFRSPTVQLATVLCFGLSLLGFDLNIRTILTSRIARVHPYIHSPMSLAILSTFPNLRSLVLRSCYYPESGDDPIPELSKLGTLTLRDLIFHDKPNFESPFISPTLSDISIDDTSSDSIFIGE